MNENAGSLVAAVPAMLGLDAADWIMIAAIILGPIFAVLVTRWIDDARDRRQRRMHVFRTLMQTRRWTLSPEHVGALNLVEIEFHDVSKVIDPFKDLMRHFGTEHARRANEMVGPNMSAEERRHADRIFDARIVDERTKLLAKLLHAVGKDLGFKIEQLEIFEGGYTPQGWNDIDTEQRIIRRYLIDLYTGNRLVPVGVVDYRRNEKAEEQKVEELEKK